MSKFLAAKKPLAKAVGTATAAIGALTPEEAEAGVITRGGKQLIEAWHGSPHKFDQFSMDSIGTGEGAQAYGHGLYFADSQGVARDYRDKLADVTFRSPDGTPFDPYGGNGLENRNVRSALVESGGDVDKAIARAEQVLERIPGTEGAELAQQDLSKLLGLKDGGGLIKDQGSLYRVELDVDPDTLLDWDKPLSELPEGARAALGDISQIDAANRSRLWDEMDLLATNDGRLYEAWENGGQLRSAADRYREGAASKADIRLIEREFDEYRRALEGRTFLGAIEENLGLTIGDAIEKSGKGPEVSAALRDAGIPGIRYLDGQSRDGGSGTYNYVMFDDKPIKITERGAATLGGMSAAAVAGAAAEFGRRRAEKKDQFKAMREQLLKTGAFVANNILEAIEMPAQGIYGLTATAGSLAAGNDLEPALMRGAEVASQPISDTAYELGGAVTDATGSPLAGTAVNVAAQVASPI